MTVKRFTINTLDGSIDLRDNNEVMTYKECCDLLNELYEENQSLKKKLEFFYELNKPYGTIIEENKELKGKLEVYRELYPSGKWICDLNSDELKKEL